MCTNTSSVVSLMTSRNAKVCQAPSALFFVNSGARAFHVSMKGWSPQAVLKGPPGPAEGSASFRQPVPSASRAQLPLSRRKIPSDIFEAKVPKRKLHSYQAKVRLRKFPSDSSWARYPKQKLPSESSQAKTPS